MSKCCDTQEESNSVDMCYHKSVDLQCQSNVSLENGKKDQSSEKQ